MRQFVLPETWSGAGPCRIDGGQARYLTRVLRLSPGAVFMGLDPQGGRHRLSVLSMDEEGILLEVGPLLADSEGETLKDTHGGRDEETAQASDGGLRRKPIPRIILVQSLAKGPAMDLVVRQAAEAGVARILPLLARRSVVRPGEEGGRAERWERIVREGLQQSGSPVPSRLEGPLRPEDLLERLGPPPMEGRLGLYLHEAPLAQTGLHEYLASAPGEIVLCVGPEGGFAPDELAIFEQAGFRPLLLPGAILRTETAALFAVASVEIILSERPTWNPSP